MSAAAASALCATFALVLVLARPTTQRLAGGESRRQPTWWAGVPGAPPLRVRIAVGSVVALASVVMVEGRLGWGVGLTAGLAATWWLGRLEGRARQRERARLAAQQPVVLELLAAALAAGLPPRAAARGVAEVVAEPSAGLLRQVVHQVEVGCDEADAWRAVASDARWAAVWGAPARDLARSVRSGSGVVESLCWQAAMARERRRSEVEKVARTIGVKSVLPLMCCYLPAFVLVGVVPIIAGLVLDFFG